MTVTTAAWAGRAHDEGVADDELAKPKRRTYSAAYKLSVLKQYEALADPGEKGAFLRREGLYSSHIVEWRRARDVGALAELQPKARRSKASAEQKELERLRKKNARLEDQLERHRKALEIQGKATELLAKLLAESHDDEQQ
jgi:transposase